MFYVKSIQKVFTELHLFYNLSCYSLIPKLITYMVTAKLYELLRAVVLFADESRSLRSIISDVCAHIGIPVTSPFPSTPTSLPVPAAAQHSHSMMLAPPCFPVGDICLIRPEFYFSWSESLSCAFWQTPGRLSSPPCSHISLSHPVRKKS